ncbi:prepilin-type N-terminal cleavage/methylation domain-containing protein [Seongchinamella sediminis]|uniref:Type II secretion system protein H n=1 Tax=Seongchinamella sediminis TaxID=2283635 RepID=A0A3L7DV50_9GAMM|nr:prepilin-type N-terminal cleavage/methylation domain-containing protein [Seongchinamella sediminis]
MEKLSCHGRQSAFTLPEFVVSLAILSLLISLGIPSFGRIISTAAIRSEAGRLVASINQTRSLAILRNLPATMCPGTSNPGQPKCSGSYRQGWIVFSDVQGNRVFDAGEDELVRSFEPIKTGYLVTNRLGTRLANEKITFYPDGTARRNLTFQVCGPDNSSEQAWSVILNIIGRPRVARGWGHCPVGEL